MHVRISAVGFMDGRDALGGQDDNRDGLRDGRLTISGEIPRFREEVILIVRFGRERGVLLGGDQWNSGGEGVVDYGEGEVGDIIFLRQSD